MSNLDNDAPWKSSHQRALDALRASHYLTETDAFLFGASILAQAFMTFLKGNYHTNKLVWKDIADCRATGCGRDRWFEATGVLEGGEFLFLNQCPHGRGWATRLALWRHAEAFEEDTYHDRDFIFRLEAYAYRPSVGFGKDAAVYQSMIDLKIAETGAIYSGQVAPAGKVAFDIINAVRVLTLEPETINYLPYATLKWHEWAV